MTWPYSYDPGVWPALITLAAAIFLGIYSWRRRSIPGARPFAITCLFGALWTIGAVLEITAVGFHTKVFWLEFQAVWQPLTAAGIACFVLSFAGLGRWLTRRNVALLCAIPILSVVAIATNGLHHLVWAGFSMNEQVIPDTGRMYWLFIGYVFLLGLVNLTVLLRLAIRSPRHRYPVAIMVSGQLIARGWYIVDKLYASLLAPGESVLLIVGLVCAAYAFAFFRFHIIDPIAAARTAVPAHMRDGMLVLDPQSRIVGSNATAAGILGMPEADLRGRVVAQVFPHHASFTAKPDMMVPLEWEVSLGPVNAARHYSASLTPLTDRSGELLGRLLLLHDVTDQKSAQTKVLEQERVVAILEERERLARELHDSIAQVLGYISIQTQAIRQLVLEGKTGEADTQFSSLLQTVRDSHRDVRESILSLRARPEGGWSFLPALGQYLSDFQSHTGIRTELLVDDGLDGSVFESEVGLQLLRVIQEALTNSRKHSQARSVRIEIGTKGLQASIAITDDGSGFDPGSEDGDDGHHFGLAFMRERMEQIGGSIVIDSVPGAGTVVNLQAPLSGREKRS